MDRVIVSNIPSSNRANFGYRSINTSESHNKNQNEIVDDILNLFNKTNEIERIVKENADFIKIENTHLESINHSLASKYEGLIREYNEIVGGDTTRKKMIFPHDCNIDDETFGAIINNITSDITVRPSSKISKLAIFDSITDGIYIPDTLSVDVRSQTINTISETDNDIYAPFYNDNKMYWTRKVVTDNSVEDVVTEYVINLAEEIMTTAEMNEIVIHPFLCNVVAVYLRYGDSNPWEEVSGSEYHPAINFDKEGNQNFINTPRPFTLTFPNTKANQIKIVLKTSNFIEGETNLRNFMFGIKHIGAYINYYNTYDASHFNTKINFDEVDTLVIEGFDFNFNNSATTAKQLSDIDYEFYYIDEYGSYQKIYESFPFVAPSRKLFVKFRIGEKIKDINIRSIVLNYKAIREDYDLLISYMQNMRVDFNTPFNLYYTVKASDSNNLVEIVTHELSLDDGATWIQIDPKFDGIRYIYEHDPIGEVCIKDRCMIRVYDFDGRVGVSNKFKISAEVFDTVPVIEQIQDIEVFVHDQFKLIYMAGDDNKITKHEFSDSDGKEWSTIVPTVEESIIRGMTFKTFSIDLSYSSVGKKNCYIRVTDGVNDPVISNKFAIDVKPISVTGVILDKYDIELVKGTKENLIATVIPSNASNKTVHWESSDVSKVIVNDYGVISGVGKGRCEVTVRTEDGPYSATCNILVTVPVESVSLNAENKILYVGEEFQLIETILPTDADDKRVVWSTSNPSCLTIDSKGLVSAINHGTAVVTVMSFDRTVSARCTFEVRVPVDDLELNKTSIKKKVGEQEQMLATVLPNNAFNKIVHWESTNPNIASVDDRGLISANSPGKATITATTDHMGISKSCAIEVLVPVSGVVLNKESTEIYTDCTEKLIATVMPPDAHDKSVRWSSSKKSVATVDENGVITPVKSGVAAITATTNDGGFSYTCVVSVKSRITDIALNPTSVNVLNVGDEKWGKDVRVYLGGYTGASNTESEEIVITSSNGKVIDVATIHNNDWVTNKSESFNFKVYGKATGKANINVRLSSGRLSRVCSVQSGDPMTNYSFRDIGKDENGDAVITVPAGMSRVVRYDVEPKGCIFHLGNSEGEPVTNTPKNGTIDYLDDGTMKIRNNAVGSTNIERFSSTYTCRGFYNNNLPGFTVNWIGGLYDIELDWSKEYPEITTVDGEKDFIIPLRFNIKSDIEGDISDYSFIDEIQVDNLNDSAVKFSMVSLIPVSNMQVHVRLRAWNLDSKDKSNTIRIKGRYSENKLPITISVI